MDVIILVFYVSFKFILFLLINSWMTFLSRLRAVSEVIPVRSDEVTN